MRRTVALLATLATVALPVAPASADDQPVKVSIVGVSTGSTLVAVCTAVSSPLVAFVTLDCQAGDSWSHATGVGVAVSDPMTGPQVCGTAVVRFTNGDTATDSACLSS